MVGLLLEIKITTIFFCAERIDVINFVVGGTGWPGLLTGLGHLEVKDHRLDGG